MRLNLKSLKKKANLPSGRIDIEGALGLPEPGLMEKIRNVRTIVVGKNAFQCQDCEASSSQLSDMLDCIAKKHIVRRIL